MYLHQQKCKVHVYLLVADAFRSRHHECLLSKTRQEICNNQTNRVRWIEFVSLPHNFSSCGCSKLTNPRDYKHRSSLKAAWQLQFRRHTPLCGWKSESSYIRLAISWFGTQPRAETWSLTALRPRGAPQRLAVAASHRCEHVISWLQLAVRLSHKIRARKKWQRFTRSLQIAVMSDNTRRLTGTITTTVLRWRRVHINKNADAMKTQTHMRYVIALL